MTCRRLCADYCRSAASRFEHHVARRARLRPNRIRCSDGCKGRERGVMPLEHLVATDPVDYSKAGGAVVSLPFGAVSWPVFLFAPMPRSAALAPD